MIRWLEVNNQRSKHKHKQQQKHKNKSKRNWYLLNCIWKYSTRNIILNKHCLFSHHNKHTILYCKASNSDKKNKNRLPVSFFCLPLSPSSSFFFSPIFLSFFVVFFKTFAHNRKCNHSLSHSLYSFPEYSIFSLHKLFFQAFSSCLFSIFPTETVLFFL